MLNLKKVSVVAASIGMLMLAACSGTTTTPTSPVVQQLVNIGNNIVAVECSAATLQTGTTVATQVLNVLAPNNATAQAAINILQENQAVAAALCPAVQAITVAIGNLPSGTPTVVPVTTGAKKDVSPTKPLPVIWL